MTHTTRWVCITVALSVLAVLYVSRLARSPAYLSIEEVGESYQALVLATTGRSADGERWPLYFSGRDPFFVYIRAGALRLLPFSETVVRLPSALAGICDIFLIFVLANRLFRSQWLALTAAILLAISPAHFFQSRVGTQQIGFVTFVLAWLVLLTRYVDSRRPRDLFLATLALGLGTYVYLAAYIVAPVNLLLTLIVVTMTQRSSPSLGTSSPSAWRPIGVAVAGFAVALLPAILWNAVHFARLIDLVDYYTHNGYNSDLGQKSLRALLVGRLDLWWNAFAPDKLFLTGDGSLRFSTRQVGYFLLPIAVLLPIGLFHLNRIQERALRFPIVAGFVLGPLPAVMVRDFEIKRWLAFMPFAILIATCGMAALIETRRHVLRVAAVALMAVAMIEFGGFLRYYWGPYREYSSFYFGRNLRGAIDEVLKTATTSSCVLLDERVLYLRNHWDLYALGRGRADLSGHVGVVDSQRADFGSPQGCTTASLIVNDIDVHDNPAFRDRLAAQGWSKTSIPESDGAVYLLVYRHLST